MTTEFLTGVVGFSASVVSFILWWPQALKVWQLRKTPALLTGVSQGAQALLILNATLWGAYAILTGSFWVGAPGLVNAPLAVWTLYILRKAATSGECRTSPEDLTKV